MVDRERMRSCRAREAKKDLTDFRVVYRGKEIPYELGSIDEQEGTVVIWFRLKKEIRRGTHNRDTGYALYFGNEKAKAPSYDASPLLASQKCVWPATAWPWSSSKTPALDRQS